MFKMLQLLKMISKLDTFTYVDCNCDFCTINNVAIEKFSSFHTFRREMSDICGIYSLIKIELFLLFLFDEEILIR